MINSILIISSTNKLLILVKLYTFVLIKWCFFFKDFFFHHLIKVVLNLASMEAIVTLPARSIVKTTTVTYKTECVLNVIPDGTGQPAKKVL